ncbi:Ig-like domain-containing protein [Mycolicibacterium vinylchloridicum]|uniref:Ig-like domain-containing protein n=1 Tax=Mycolicibacterium vinylchloridicum TaxID=2736928 RepID=UPI0015C9C3C4|nr:Ig-like domain-containing protein [Mycolicibacterium vinylchloridicum]
MQSTILVPRLAAAAFAIGVGVAIGSCATAAADTGAADSSSASSNASAGRSTASAARTAARPARAATPTAEAPAKTGTARAARVVAAPRVATASVAAGKKLREPSQLQVGVDILAANIAGLLGYTPQPANVGGVHPVLPLRTIVLDALAALRRATDSNPANGLPVLKPREVYQFVTGEVLGDLLPSDPDGNQLTYHVAQGPANGTLTVNPNGTYYYKPTNDFAEAGGIDTFIVIADDGQQGQTVVPVNVKVHPTLGISENFWFRNYTLAPIKFTGYNGGTEDLDGGPAVGTVINPGGEAGWSVTWYMFSVGSVTPQFGTVGFGATPSNPGYIPAGYVGTTFQITYKTKPRETQCSAGGGGECSVPNDKMAIALDKDSPTITLGAEDAAKITAVLPNVCYDGSIANCGFNAKSETKGFSPVRTVGTPVSNTTSTPTTYSIAIADQVSQSDTVGLSVKLSGGGLAKLASIINIEITANYSHTWVSTHTFTQTMNVPVGAGKTAWIEGSVPVWNVTGDFTVKLGKSTYQLNGARFSTPNPNEPGSYVIRDKPIASTAD